MRKIIEQLETRSLLAVVIGADGSVVGRTETYIPAGGIHIASDAEMGPSRGSAEGAPGFQITVQFGSGLTASQQAVFTSAAAKWQSIILGDLVDVGVIDDVRITASGIAIDGVNGILGQAGPTGFRNAANDFIPYQGIMQFDTADLASLESAGQLQNVIVHEMGHVLGIGTIWSNNGVISGSGTSNPTFTGTNALAEYNKMLTADTTSVPVENTGGSGTANSHWRESSFATELMTGYLNFGQVNPLSRLTAASMVDIGYTQVDYEAADSYTRTNAIPTIGTLSATASVPAGGNVTLTLTSATDVSQIKFYRESNGITGLQATGTTAYDTLVGTISSGLSTSVPTTGLPVGTYSYYAIVVDSRGLQSVYRVATSNITVAIAAPSAPDLDSSSDLGVSSTDDITADNTPTFNGTATANTIVQLFDGASLAGSTTSDGSGNWSITTGTLSNGSHTFTAKTTDGVNTSLASAALVVQIDTIAPSLISANYDRNISQDVIISFDDVVAGSISTGDLTLTNTTTSAVVPGAVSNIVVAGGGLVATIEFGSLLANGRYTLSMPASAATDIAGNAITSALSLNFVQLAGDANNDATVNFDDLLVLAQNYGASSVGFSNGDFNYDGVVGFDDLLLLAQNYNVTLFSSVVIGNDSRATKQRKANNVGVVA